MRLASLRDLFNYGAWANACVWDTAADLNDAQMDRAFEMGEGSLRKTLTHIYGAERAWYERCEVPDVLTLPGLRRTGWNLASLCINYAPGVILLGS